MVAEVYPEYVFISGYFKIHNTILTIQNVINKLTSLKCQSVLYFTNVDRYETSAVEVEIY
jgi:hypothetical protein